MFLCILNSIVSVYTTNLTLTLSFFNNISNDPVKCDTIRNMGKYIMLYNISCICNVSHFFYYVFYTLHICALCFSELLHFLSMETKNENAFVSNEKAHYQYFYFLMYIHVFYLSCIFVKFVLLNINEIY